MPPRLIVREGVGGAGRVEKMVDRFGEPREAKGDLERGRHMIDATLILFADRAP
jgi:hypothetical protein